MVATKICKQCGADMEKPYKYSSTQWASKKFCSRHCLGLSQQKNDGMDRSTRHRRKNGAAKFGSQEHRDKISRTTAEAMRSPFVQDKLHASRQPLKTAHRKKISDALVGKIPANVMNQKFGNVRRGWYVVAGKKMFFRSEWEWNYALYLNWLISKKEIDSWEYEADVFIFHNIQFGTRSYTPDFKVFNNDGSVEYHEIKGYMTKKSATQLKRMKKYYPEVKLVLVDGKCYNAIMKWHALFPD